MMIFYCSYCVEELNSYGELNFLIYEDICNHFALFQYPMKINSKAFDGTNEIVKFLEQKGFLVTSEDLKKDFKIIYVKPRCHKYIGYNRHIFCAKGHKDEFI